MPSLWPPIIRWRWGHSATCVLLSSPHLSLECFLPRAEESAPVSVFLDPLEVSPGGFDLLPPLAVSSPQSLLTHSSLTPSGMAVCPA